MVLKTVLVSLTISLSAVVLRKTSWQTMKHALLDPNNKRVIIVIIILSTWTEYWPEPYTRDTYGGNAFLDCNQPQDEYIQPIIREKVEIAPKTEKFSELIVYQPS